jgi:hypothetical protein
MVGALDLHIAAGGATPGSAVTVARSSREAPGSSVKARLSTCTEAMPMIVIVAEARTLGTPANVAVTTALPR